MGENTNVPDLEKVEVVERPNGDYDLKFYLDKTNLSDKELQDIIDKTFHMLFVVFGDHGWPMDSHYIEFV